MGRCFENGDFVEGEFTTCVCFDPVRFDTQYYYSCYHLTPIGDTPLQEDEEPVEQPIYNCRKPDGSYAIVRWRYFYTNCAKLGKQCSATKGAYLPAVTVCRQRLW